MSQVALTARAANVIQVPEMCSTPGRCNNSTGLQLGHQPARMSSQPVHINMHPAQKPLIKKGNALCQAAQAAPSGIRPAVPEMLNGNELPHTDTPAGLATPSESKSDDAESVMAMSTVDSVGRPTVAKQSISGTGSTSGSEMDPENKGQESFLAAVMQRVEDRVADLIHEHSLRIKGDLLNTEITMKAHVDASHEMLMERHSQLSMAHEADRQQLQELREEVQALRSEQIQSMTSFALSGLARPSNLAAANDASANDERVADLEARLDSIKQSVQEWVRQALTDCDLLARPWQSTTSTGLPRAAEEKSPSSVPIGDPFATRQALADCNPLARPWQSITSTGLPKAEEGKSPLLVPTGNPLPQVPGYEAHYLFPDVPIHSQLPNSSLSPTQMLSAQLMFDYESFKCTASGRVAAERSEVYSVADKVTIAAATASSDARAEHAVAEHLKFWRKPNEVAQVAASPCGWPKEVGLQSERPPTNSSHPLYLRHLIGSGARSQGSVTVAVNCGKPEM